MVFSINPGTQSKLCPVFFTVTSPSGALYCLETPLRVSADQWDQEKQAPRNMYLKSDKQLNRHLNKLKIGMARYMEQKRIKKEEPTNSQLSKQIQKICAQPVTSYTEQSLLSHIQHYIDSRQHLISPSTRKRYIVFFRLIERFEGHCLKNLFIEDINASFVREFLSYGVREQYSISTIYRTIHFIRTVLHFLEKKDIRTYAYELELPKEQKSKKFVTLSEDELLRIERTEMPPALQTARDWLIISCYTGQRISDFMSFNNTHIRNVDVTTCLSFVQKKTQKNIILPLHPVVTKIISRYGGGFPEKIPENTYNEQIKQVVKIAGINDIVTVRKRQGFRTSTSLLAKWEAITSHIGRRSFASNFYGKIPTPLLMEATGHSSEQMFHRYINPLDTERVLSLGRYFEKAYKEKFLVEKTMSAE